MAAWTALLKEANAVPPQQRAAWFETRLGQALADISSLRSGRHVLLYATAFLQKPQLPSFQVALTSEEINGFMSCMFGMNVQRGLTLILHTPGGQTNAAETVVQYLHSKYNDIEVVVPAFAMSAGTMIGLASNRLIMGRQSQIGPIDPQMPMNGKFVSARAIVDQFERAKKEISADTGLAHAWAPVLASLGPALLVEAQNALDYGERMVREWAEARMFAGQTDGPAKAAAVAQFFNDAGTHKSHGRRIGRDEAAAQGVVIESLEASQDLQDKVLTAYHLATLMFEQTQVCKMIWADHGQQWIKNA
ncbi:SDH family Clp fold serine proteinase [Aquabacterium humicola]|uniref:SDH family Clp fold serine proteinase n=1 Tax=Aquabacterium humicola TaxID=3237377 RepID=UPI002542CBFB|nr:hypothetical protein [Rubrivivax pictus]